MRTASPAWSLTGAPLTCFTRYARYIGTLRDSRDFSSPFSPPRVHHHLSLSLALPQRATSEAPWDTLYTEPFSSLLAEDARERISRQLFKPERLSKSFPEASSELLRRGKTQKIARHILLPRCVCIYTLNTRGYRILKTTTSRQYWTYNGTNVIFIYRRLWSWKTEPDIGQLLDNFNEKLFYTPDIVYTWLFNAFHYS